MGVRRQRPDAVQVPSQQPHQGALQQVLGVVEVAGEHQRGPQQRLAVHGHEFLERHRVHLPPQMTRRRADPLRAAPVMRPESRRFAVQTHRGRS